MDQPRILGVKVTDPAQLATIEAEMNALAQRYGLEAVKGSQSSREEVVAHTAKLESAISEINKFSTDFTLLREILRDFRRPAVSIQAALDLILEQARNESELTSDDIRPFFELIRQNAIDFNDVLTRLTNFMASDNGYIDFRSQPSKGKFSVDDAIAAFTKNRRYSADNRKLDVSFGTELGTMYSDLYRLKGILWGIYIVTVKASMNGDIALSVTREADVVTFSFSTIFDLEEKVELVFKFGREWHYAEKLCQILDGSVTRLHKGNTLEVVVHLPTNLDTIAPSE